MAEPIHAETFPNGLVLVAEPMAWLESAAFALMVPAGSVYDPDRQSGLASFTCEMALRGAGPRDGRRFVDDLDTLGIHWTDSVNDAHTAFRGATLSANLPDALALFADVVRRPHLPDDELEAARQAMLQELRAIEDEPAQKVMLELRRRHYPHPWGRPSQGERGALEAITIDDVRGHFARGFRPDRAILAVAGSFEWDRLRDTVESLFGDWPVGDECPVDEEPWAAAHDHLAHDSNQMQIGISYDSVPYRHPDYFQAWGAVGVLSGGMSARLFTEVRERRGLCYSVYATYHYLRDRAGVFCYAGTGAERAQETLDVMVGELERLARGVEAGELDRLKARIKSLLIMQQESSSARSAAIARDWYHLGRVRTLEEVGGLVDGLTCDSINAYLAEHPPGRFTVVTLGPRPLEMPAGVA